MLIVNSMREMNEMLLTSVLKSLSILVSAEHPQQPHNLTCALDEATVVNDIKPYSIGRVVMHGVYWKAKATEDLSSKTIPLGKTVTISHRKGLTLYVRPEII